MNGQKRKVVYLSFWIKCELNCGMFLITLSKFLAKLKLLVPSLMSYNNNIQPSTPPLIGELHLVSQAYA